jgi:hypothetical protein
MATKDSWCASWNARSPAAHEVVAQIAAGDRAGLHRGVARLNDCDVVIVQHEYGVYGRLDDEDILPLFDGLCVPCIVVHTVLLVRRGTT